MCCVNTLNVFVNKGNMMYTLANMLLSVAISLVITYCMYTIDGYYALTTLLVMGGAVLGMQVNEVLTRG
jgi:hypothetical protein